MIELFEFEVLRGSGSTFPEEYWDEFITEFLEPRLLFWGGGAGPDYFRGVISSEENIDINKVIDDLGLFFHPDDKIIIRLIDVRKEPLDHFRLSKLTNVAFEPYVF